jgi:hypothetical protein
MSLWGCFYALDTMKISCMVPRCECRPFSSTTQVFDMARPLILAVCTIALLISVQQSSAGMMASYPCRYQGSLVPIMCGNILPELRDVFPIRCPISSKLSFCDSKTWSTYVMPFRCNTHLTDIASSRCRRSTPAQCGAFRRDH